MILSTGIDTILIHSLMDSVVILAICVFDYSGANLKICKNKELWIFDMCNTV